MRRRIFYGTIVVAFVSVGVWLNFSHSTGQKSYSSTDSSFCEDPFVALCERNSEHYQNVVQLIESVLQKTYLHTLNQVALKRGEKGYRQLIAKIFSAKGITLNPELSEESYKKFLGIWGPGYSDWDFGQEAHSHFLEYTNVCGSPLEEIKQVFTEQFFEKDQGSRRRFYEVNARLLEIEKKTDDTTFMLYHENRDLFIETLLGSCENTYYFTGPIVGRKLKNLCSDLDDSKISGLRKLDQEGWLKLVKESAALNSTLHVSIPYTLTRENAPGVHAMYTRAAIACDSFEEALKLFVPYLNKQAMREVLLSETAIELFKEFYDREDVLSGPISGIAPQETKKLKALAKGPPLSKDSVLLPMIRDALEDILNEFLEAQGQQEKLSLDNIDLARLKALTAEKFVPAELIPGKVLDLSAVPSRSIYHRLHEPYTWTKINASYFPMFTSRPGTVHMLPAMKIIKSILPAAYLEVLAHEVGHHVDPDHGPDLMSSVYSRILGCYREQDSILMSDVQAGETFADYAASLVVTKVAPTLGFDLREITEFFCVADEIPKDLFRAGYIHRRHPLIRDRVNGIFFSNPALMDAVGCAEPPKGYRACGF